MEKISRRHFLATGGLLAGAAMVAPIGKLNANLKVNELSEGSSSKGPTLRFNKNGKFKIMQITDMHYILSRAEESNLGVTDISNYLDIEKPDLIMMTGDVVYTNMDIRGLEAVFAPMVSHGVPFAFTWGNHDGDDINFRIELQKRVEQEPLNEGFTVRGIPGYSNYALPILSSTGNKEAAIVYGFDSNKDSSIQQVKGRNWITREQIKWYERMSEDYTKNNGGIPLPSYSFFHIPLPEFKIAYEDAWTHRIGTRWENIETPLINSGLFLSMLEHKDMVGVFCGHDHDNDFIVNYYGIKLVYGQVTGRKTAYCNMPDGYGARFIILDEGKREFNTYIRLAKGGTTLHVNTAEI